MADQQLWVRTSDGIVGPHSPSEVREFARIEKITRDTLLSADKEKWIPAGRVRGLRFIHPEGKHVSEAEERKAHESKAKGALGFKDWVEVTKNVFECGALLSAGIWAYMQFSEKDKPFLGLRAAATTQIHWARPTKDSCSAIFSVTVRNSGSRPFDLEKLQIRGWVVPRPPCTEVMSRLNPEELMSGKPAFFLDIIEGSLMGEYMPQEELSDDFAFTVSHKADLRDDLVLFRFDAEAVDGDDKKALDDYRWTGNCQVEYGNQLEAPASAAVVPTPERTEIPHGK